jgi:hypothetical protein
VILHGNIFFATYLSYNDIVVNFCARVSELQLQDMLISLAADIKLLGYTTIS